jgi:hypothetical protein
MVFGRMALSACSYKTKYEEFQMSDRITSIPCSTKQRRHPAASTGPVEAIWRAAAILRWHVPVLDGDDSALPYIALEGDEPVALVFTTRRRSRAAIGGWIGEVSDMDVRSVAVSRKKALSVLGRLHARGLQWIRIDHGPSSIRLPLEPLVGAMQRLWEQDAALTRDESAWAWLERQDRVLVLRDPAAIDLPLIEILDETPTVRLFVGKQRILAQASHLALRNEQHTQNLVMELDGDSSIDCLRRLASLGVERVVIEQAGGRQTLSLHSLLRQARRAA